MKKPTEKKEKKDVKKKSATPGKHAAPAKKATPSKVKKTAVKKPAKEQIIEKPVALKTGKPEFHEEHKPEPKPVHEKKKPPKSITYHGTGGRKTSVARVWLSAGTGKYLINGRPMEQYANNRPVLCKMAIEPFTVTQTTGKFDVSANVMGGGYASQIGAVRQGVSEAMLSLSPEYRPSLKKAGLLTRDPREKERKKYGQKRARKRFQYSKR